MWHDEGTSWESRIQFVGFQDNQFPNSLRSIGSKRHDFRGYLRLSVVSNNYVARSGDAVGQRPPGMGPGQRATHLSDIRPQSISFESALTVSREGKQDKRRKPNEHL